ncbi:MAG: DUF2306 domain-containing protein [Actinomycetota bacterium]
MSIPGEVLATYLALAVWVVSLVVGFRRGSFRSFFLIGIGIMLVLNVRYLISGPEIGISNFVALYDLFDNLGLGTSEGAPALAQCPDNACSIWDRYSYHPSWGVAFYDRFVNGPDLRTNLLYGHILFNSIAFVLLHVQLFRTGVGANAARHRLLGRLTFGSVTIGTVFAVWLSSQHDEVDEYGGLLAELGFSSMSAVVYGTAVMSVVAIRQGSAASHRIWSIRFAGAMWGSFWLFRVMLVVTGPLLRNWESASILWSIWASAPLGVLIAEWARRRHDRRSVVDLRATPTADEAVRS